MIPNENECRSIANRIADSTERRGVIPTERRRVRDLPAALKLLVDPSPHFTQLRMTLRPEYIRTYANSVVSRVISAVVEFQTQVVHRLRLSREDGPNSLIPRIAVLRGNVHRGYT